MNSQSKRVAAVAPIAERLGGVLYDRVMGSWRFPSPADAERFSLDVYASGLEAWRHDVRAGVCAIDVRRGMLVRSLVHRAAFEVRGSMIGPVRVGDELRVSGEYDHNGYVDLVAPGGVRACLHASEFEVVTSGGTT